MLYNDSEYHKFKKWLSFRQAMFIDPTNEWEVLRFNSINGIGVVYRNKYDKVTLTGEAKIAYKLWKENKGASWNSAKRKNISSKGHVVKRLKARDGLKCFYCDKELDFETDKSGERVSIEHLLSVCHGGTNHIANLALAHEKCNGLAASLDLVSKIKLREGKVYGLTENKKPQAG